MYSSVRESHVNFKSRRRKYPISFQPERPNGRFKFKNFCRCFRKEKNSKSNVTPNFNEEKFDKEKLQDDISPILKEITSKFFEKEFNKYFDTEITKKEKNSSGGEFLSTNYFQVSRPIKLDAFPITCNYGNKTFNKGTQYLSASSLQSGVEEKLFMDMKDETTQTEFNLNLADKITQYSNKFQCNKETNTSNISQKSTMILFANQSKMFESTDDTLKEDEVNETKKNRSVRINLDKDLKKRSCCTNTSDTCIYEDIQNKFFEWLEFVRKDKNVKSILIKPKNEEGLKSKPSVYKLRVKTPKKDEIEERKEALSKVAEFLTADNPILTEDVQKSLNKLSGNNREKLRYPTFIGADIKVNDDDVEVTKKKRGPKIIIGKKKLKNNNEDDSIKKVDLEIDAITSKMEKYLEVLLHDDQSSLGSDSIIESNQNEQRMELCPIENQSVCRNTPVTLLHPLLHNIHMKTLNKKDSKKDLKKPLNEIKSEEKKEFKFGNFFKKKIEPKIIQNQNFNVLNVSSKERGTLCNKNDLADISTMAGNSFFESVDKSTNTFNGVSQSMGVQTTINVRNKKLFTRRNTFHIGVQTNLDDFNQDDENERILYPRDRKVNELDRKKVKEYFFKAKKVVTGLLSKGKYSNSWSNTEEIDEEDSGSVENLNIPLKVKFSNVIMEGDAKDSTTKVINLPEESSDIDDDEENENDDDDGGLSDDGFFRKQTVLSFYSWCFSNKDEDRFLKNEKKMFELTHLGSGDNNFVSPPSTGYFNRVLTYPVITEDVKSSPRQEKVKIISTKIKKKKINKKKSKNESKRIKKTFTKNRNRKSLQQKQIRDISIYSVDNYIQFGSSSSIVDQEFVKLKQSEQNLKTPVKIEVTKELKDELINDPILKEELITKFRPIGPDDIKLIKKESKNLEDDIILTLKKNLLSSPKTKSEIVKKNSFSSTLENSDIFSDLPSDIIDEILDEFDVLTGENPLIEDVEEEDQDGEVKQKFSWGRLAERYKKIFARKKRSKSKLNLVTCCKRGKKKKEKIKERKKKKVKVKRVKKKDESKRRWYHFWKPPKIKEGAEDPLDLIEEEKPYPFWKDDFEPVLMSGDLVGKTKIIVKPLPRITRAFPKIKEIGESPEDLLLTPSTLLKLTPQREQIEKSNLQLAYGGTPSARNTLSLPKNRKQHIYNLQQILPSRNSLVLLHKGPPSLESSTITISERFQITTESESSDEFLFRPPQRFPKNNLNELEIIHPKTIYLVSGLRQHISDEMLMVLLRTYMWRRIHKPMITDVEPCLEDAKVEEDDTITSLSIFDEDEEVLKDVEVEETKEDASNELNLLRDLLRGKDKVKKGEIDDENRYDILVSDDEVKKEEDSEGVVKKIVDDVVKKIVKDDFVGDDKKEDFDILVQNKEEEIKVVDFEAKLNPKNAFEYALSGVGKPILEISDEFRAFLKSIGVFEPPEIKRKKKKAKIITKKSVQTSNEFYVEKLNPPLDEGLISRSKSLPEIKPLSGRVKKIKSSFCNIPKSSKISLKIARKAGEVKETKKICLKMRPKPKIIKQAPLQPIFHEELKISGLNKENQENEENEVIKYEEKKLIPLKKRKLKKKSLIGKKFKHKLMNEKFLKHLEKRKCPKSCASINFGESSDEIKSKIRNIKSKIRKSAKIEVEKFNKILRNLQKIDSDDKSINYNDKLKNVVTLKKSQTQTERFLSKKCPESCKIKKSDKFFSKIDSDDDKELKCLKIDDKMKGKFQNLSDDKDPKCLKIYDKMKMKLQNQNEIESKDDSDDVKELKCFKKIKAKLQNRDEIESKNDFGDVKELKCFKKIKKKLQNRDEIESKDDFGDVKESKCLKIYDKMRMKFQNRDEIESEDDFGDVKELKCFKKIKTKLQNRDEIESKDDFGDVKESKCLKIYDKMRMKFQNRDEIESEDDFGDVKELKCFKKIKTKLQNRDEIESKDDFGDVKELKCFKKIKEKLQNRNEIESKDDSEDLKDSKYLKMYDKMKSKLVKKILEGSIKKSPKFNSSSVTTLNKSSTQTDEEESETDFNPKIPQNETNSKPKINNEKKSLRFQDDFFDKNDDNFPKSGESQKNEESTDSPKTTESSKLLIKIKRNNFDSFSNNTIETRKISETSSISASTSTEPDLINNPKQNSLSYQCGVLTNPFYNSNQIKLTSYSSTISDDGNLAQIIKNEVKLINFDPNSSFTSFSSFLSSPSENYRVNRRLLAQEIANDIKKKSELFKKNRNSSSLSEKISKINYFDPKRTDYHVNYFNSVDKLGFLDTSFSVNERSFKYPSNLIVKEDLVGEETKSSGIKCRLELIYRKMPIALDSELGMFCGSREFCCSEGPSEMKKRKKSRDVSPKSFFAEPIECFTATAQVEHIQTENENDKENNLHDLYLIKSDTIVRRDDPNGGVSISKSSEDFFCPPQGKKAKTFKANLNNVFKECNDIFQKVKRFHQPMIDPLMKSNVLCVSKKGELNFPMIEDGKKKKKKESKASLDGSDDSKKSRRKSSKDRSVKDASRETSKDDLDVAKDDHKTESRDSITTVTRRSNPTLSVETDSTRTIESSGPSSLNCDGQCQTEGLCYCKMWKGNNNQIKHSRPIKVMDKEQRDFGNNYQALIKPYTCCIHAKEEGRNYCKKVTFDQMRRNEANSFCTDSSVTSIEAVKKLIGKKKHKYKDKSETKLLNCGKGTIDAVISEGYKEEPNSKMSGYVDKKRKKSIHLDRKKKHVEGGSETSSKDTSSTKIPFFRRLFKSKRERSKSRDRSKRRKKEKESSNKLPPGIRRLQASYNEKYAALKRRMRKEDGEVEFELCSCPRDEDDVVIVEEGGKKSKKKCCAKKVPPKTKQSQKNELPITTKCACNILDQQFKGRESPGIQRRPRLIKKRSKSNEVTPKSSQRSILKKKRHKRSSTQYEEGQDKKLTFKDDLGEENDVNQNDVHQNYFNQSDGNQNDVNQNDVNRNDVNRNDVNRNDVNRNVKSEVENERNVKGNKSGNSSSGVSHNASKGKHHDTHSSKFKPPKKSKKERKLEEQVFSETNPKVIDQKGCVCDDFETFSSIVVRTPDPSEPGCCSMCKKKSSEKSEKHPNKKKASKSKSKSKLKHSSEGRLSTSNASKSRVKPKKVEKCEKAEKGSYSTKEDSSKCFCDYEDEEMKKLLLAPHPSMLKTSTKSSPKSSLRSSKKNSFIKPRKARSKGSSRISSEEFVRTHEYDVRHLELPPTLQNIYHKPHKNIPGKDEIFETLISMLFKEKRNKKGESTRKRMVKKYLSQVSSTELEDIVLELVRSLPNDILTINSKNEDLKKNEIKLNVSKGYLKRFKKNQFERNVFCSKYSKKVSLISCSEDCSCIAEPCSSGVSDVNDDMINNRKADFAIDVDKVEVFCRNCDSWCTLSSSDKEKKNQNRLVKEDNKNGDDSKEIVELIRILSNLSPKDLCGFFSKQCMK